MKLFVPLVGQHENIGDIVLRRELVEWLVPLGQIHAYVGASSDSYDHALELPSDSVTYRSTGAWARALGSAARHRDDVAYVYKPGEIQLTFPGLKEHLGMLPLVALVRACGGAVVRVGSGSRNFKRLPTLVVRSTLSLSHFTAWRDTRTAKMLGRGEVMPDLGFGQVKRTTPVDSQRHRLTITMRGDRTPPSQTWRDAIRGIAEELALRVTVVTQVERDEALSAELANELGADYVPWQGRDHLDQEQAVRRAYAESRLVVSDRLHALIVAVTEGAAVASVADRPTDKILRHFQAAGIPIVVQDSAATSEEEVREALRIAVREAPDQRAALVGTLQSLGETRARMSAAIRRADA